MSLNLTKKQKKKRRNIVGIFTYGSFFLFWLSFNMKIVSAFALAIGVYILSYGVFELLDYKRRKLLITSGITQIDTFDGFQFEHYLVELFKKYNYKAVRTPDSGDYGADLILKKEKKKIVVQAKRYKNAVGIKAVQEVLGAKAYYKADEAWVVANSKYTKAAIKLAKESNVRLIARDELISMLIRLNNISEKPNPVDIKANIEVKDKKFCSECGSEMVLRNSKYGVFYGCSNFPKCANRMEAK